MTRGNYQQYWYTGVVLITKLEHYLTVSGNQKHFWGFEIRPNPRDTGPLTDQSKIPFSMIIFF